MPRYRVQVQFDAARNVFVARAPELPPSTAEGATRAEALARLEEEIEAQVATITDQGGTAPRAVDELEAVAVSDSPDGAAPLGGLGSAGKVDGRVSARVSPALHRELLYLARVEGLPLDVLLGELLSESLALRSARELRAPRGERSDRDRGRGDRGDRGNRRNERDDRDRDRNRGPGYNEIMESSSSFLQYVRGLEGGGGGGGRRGGGGGGGNRGNR